MVVILELIGFIIELIALLSFFIVVYHVYHIKILSKGFENIWNFITLGFLLIIFRRFFQFFLPFIKEGVAKEIIQNLILPLLLLSISILFIYGFYKLDKLFDSIKNTKKRAKR